MLGEKLINSGGYAKRRAAMAVTVVAALVSMAAVDSVPVAPAPAKDTSLSVDTSIAKSGGAPALATAADSSSSAPVIDTSAAAVADTVNASLAADTSALVNHDTLSLALSGDSDRVDDGGDKLAADVLPPFASQDKKPLFGDSKLLRFAAANAAYILFFGVSLAVILAAFFYFFRRQDTRRFLTTTRLSVLDKMVQKGCRYIESNYMNPELSVGTVCRELVTGEAYLDTLFVKEIGIDVHDFIAQVRVNRIKNLLKEDPTVDSDSIYKQCGFNDRASADRCFAKLCGGVGIEIYAKSLVSAGKTPEA